MEELAPVVQIAPTFNPDVFLLTNHCLSDHWVVYSHLINHLAEGRANKQVMITECARICMQQGAAQCLFSGWFDS